MDESSDGDFYAQPRFCTHIDDGAIGALQNWYGEMLPAGEDKAVLDICSSWISHYPEGYSAGRVAGLGMNAKVGGKREHGVDGAGSMLARADAARSPRSMSAMAPEAMIRAPWLACRLTASTACSEGVGEERCAHGVDGQGPQRGPDAAVRGQLVRRRHERRCDETPLLPDSGLLLPVA